MSNNIFYHASNIKGLKEILPLSASKNVNDTCPVCYFTPNKIYSFFYLRDLEINHVTCGVNKDNIVAYHEQFPNQLNVLYNGRSGYIYSCENDGVISSGHTDSVWFSVKPVNVLNCEYIENVYDEIIKAEKDRLVKVKRYEDHTEEEKEEMNEVLKNFILKRNFVHSSTKQSLFFKEYYPISWQRAVSEDNNAEK